MIRSEKAIKESASLLGCLVLDSTRETFTALLVVQPGITNGERQVFWAVSSSFDDFRVLF